MKTVYILGRGQSLKSFATAGITPGSDVILMNDHSKTLENPQIAAKLTDANI